MKTLTKLVSASLIFNIISIRPFIYFYFFRSILRKLYDPKTYCEKYFKFFVREYEIDLLLNLRFRDLISVEFDKILSVYRNRKENFSKIIEYTLDYLANDSKLNEEFINSLLNYKLRPSTSLEIYCSIYLLKHLNTNSLQFWILNTYVYLKRETDINLNFFNDFIPLSNSLVNNNHFKKSILNNFDNFDDFYDNRAIKLCNRANSILFKKEFGLDVGYNKDLAEDITSIPYVIELDRLQKVRIILTDIRLKFIFSQLKINAKVIFKNKQKKNKFIFEKYNWCFSGLNLIHSSKLHFQPIPHSKLFIDNYKDGIKINYNNDILSKLSLHPKKFICISFGSSQGGLVRTSEKIINFYIDFLKKNKQKKILVLDPIIDINFQNIVNNYNIDLVDRKDVDFFNDLESVFSLMHYSEFNVVTPNNLCEIGGFVGNKTYLINVGKVNLTHSKDGNTHFLWNSINFLNIDQKFI